MNGTKITYGCVTFIVEIVECEIEPLTFRCLQMTRAGGGVVGGKVGWKKCLFAGVWEDADGDVRCWGSLLGVLLLLWIVLHVLVVVLELHMRLNWVFLMLLLTLVSTLHCKVYGGWIVSWIFPSGLRIILNLFFYKLKHFMQIIKNLFIFYLKNIKYVKKIRIILFLRLEI